MTTMKAVRIHDYGGTETMRFEDAPVPEPRGGEALVRVLAAGVNPVDWKIREGLRREKLAHHLPLTLGWDIAGVIERPAAGGRFERGEEVFGMLDLRLGGGYAEFVAVNENRLAAKPAALDFVHAAAAPLAALTAWQSLFDVAGLHRGQRVLIHAAAGGVGSFAVQLARLRGAEAVATASARHHDYLRELGAGTIIDYTQTPFEQAAGEVDVVFDTVGDETRQRSWPLLKPGGALVSIVSPPQAEETPRRDIRMAFHLVDPKPGQLDEIARLLDEGSLKSSVEAVYEFARAAEALQRVRDGHVQGKIVLKVSD